MQRQEFSADPERVAYDSAEMPLYIRNGKLSDYPNMAFVCHWHEDIEFLYVRTGRVTYNVNGELYTINAGEGIFINARQLHFGYSADKSDGDFLCILLHPLLLSTNAFLEQKYIVTVTENHNFPVLQLKTDVPWMKKLLDLLQETACTYNEKEPGFELEIQSCFLREWLLIYQNMPLSGDEPYFSKAKLPVLRNMINYIQRRSAEKIRLSEIAASGNVCESTCCQLFRRYLSRTPTEYLTEYRLSQACILLNKTQMTITEIAFQVGFSGASYFAEQFKKYYACSPTELRGRAEKSNSS
ncbi:AraC family transcriptional regulator [Pseudoflavonifractor phocaeensis]|uniref:AraC family transcriptional regulator n=1 Tax=Pseudoflavonifractor phocaeensis TaxID=1870988 RepID=UPI00210D8D77|nr:helix-turn-helix domain-containing protein [Pseudoflavonifractor phocaeensis]MCQ4862690.1 AraC family transcriptional regulator [Pseudoflavonifractor phocaeensis]